MATNHSQRLKNDKNVLDIKPWRAESFTASDLLLNPPPPPEWIVKGFLPVGLSYLAGRPKTGKSLLAGQIARAVSDPEATLFGLEVRHGPVLYIDVENSRWRLYDRMKKAGYFNVGPSSDRLHYATDWMPGNRSEFLRKLDEIKPVFVAVDTWAKFRAPRYRDMDQYEHESEELRWQHKEANERSIGILDIGHRTKMDDPNDPFVNFAGSTAVTGGVDTMLAFSKVAGETQLRQLQLRGRDTGDETLILRVDEHLNCSRVCNGDQFITADQARYLKAMGGGVWAQPQLAREMGVSQPAVSKMLSELRDKGLVHAIVGGSELTQDGRRIAETVHQPSS